MHCSEDTAGRSEERSLEDIGWEKKLSCLRILSIADVCIAGRLPKHPAAGGHYIDPQPEVGDAMGNYYPFQVFLVNQ